LVILTGASFDSWHAYERWLVMLEEQYINWYGQRRRRLSWYGVLGISFSFIGKGRLITVNYDSFGTGVTVFGCLRPNATVRCRGGSLHRYSGFRGVHTSLRRLKRAGVLTPARFCASVPGRGRYALMVVTDLGDALTIIPPTSSEGYKTLSPCTVLPDQEEVQGAEISDGTLPDLYDHAKRGF
jgi:hypothetical protein